MFRTSALIQSGLLVLGSLLLATGVVASAELTAEQRADLEYFGLTSNLDKGDVLLNQLYGGCNYNPYRVLDTKYKGGGPNRCGPEGTRITPTVTSGSSLRGIDAALACRLTKLFDAAAERGCSVKIISAYRSEQQQACMCGGGRSGCAAAGSSCHQYGLAVDVSSSCIGWLRRAAPEFRLVFPYYGDHIQCAEHPRASRSSCNRQCDGGTPITPDLSRIPSPSQVPDTYFVLPPGGSNLLRDEINAPSSPSSGFTNQIRQALGVAPQSTAAPVSQPSQTNTVQPSQICSPSFTCSNNAMYYQSSTCTREIYQQCPYGCAGNACAASSTVPTTDVIGGAFGTSTPATTEATTDDEEDPVDTISSYIGSFNATAVDIGTGTPITLALSTIRDIAGISGSASVSGLGTSSSVIITSQQPTNSQQTFTSSDLSGNVPLPSGADSYTGFQAALAQMRASLEWAIQYLKPFGGFEGRR